MPKQTTNDGDLITGLQALLDNVSALRRGLIHPKRAGCMCEGANLCALHASIDNRLRAVSNELAAAIHDAGQE